MLFPKKIDQYRIVEREQELNTRAKPTQDSDVNPDQNLRFLRGVESDVMSLIRTDYVPEWRISAHAQSVLAAGQKHHNSSPLASACNM